MGTSRAREEYPYIVLRGCKIRRAYRQSSILTVFLVTSDHVNIYLAGKFRENNERGSAEGLKFVRFCPHFFACLHLNYNNSLCS